MLLPWTVGKWWYGTQKLTKEKALRQSAANLFQAYDDDMTDGDVVNALSGGEEYQGFLASRADTGLNKIEQKLSQEGVNAGLTAKYEEKLKSLEGVRRKAAALLWAYLGRTELNETALDAGETAVLRLLVSIG